MQGEQDHAHHASRSEAGGMVMNENLDKLPGDCASISSDVELEIHAGAKFAGAFPGEIFAYEQQALQVPPCSRVTVSFSNHDDVRHQWMVHGLPRYLYPGGMFHIETNGGATVSGTFIVPSDDRTYLVHCDLPQHMQKGMKAQLVVGSGDGDLWSVPGISGDLEPDTYPWPGSAVWIAAAFAVGLLVARLLSRN